MLRSGRGLKDKTTDILTSIDATILVFISYMQVSNTYPSFTNDFHNELIIS